MAIIKISELSSASGLTGTEIVPVVQSGSTVQTTAQDIADLADTSSLAADITALETAAGNQTGEGTSFPMSPTTGDRFYRTDRRIEYFYDSTRWLSTNLYSTPVVMQEGSLTPISASNANVRVGHPFGGMYDIYVEKFIVTSYNTATTASNYFTFRLETRDGTTSAQLGSGLSGQGDTQNSAITHSENINTVVASTVDTLLVVVTETGAATMLFTAVFTYRIIG